MIQTISAAARTKQHEIFFGVFVIIINVASHYFWYTTGYSTIIQYAGLVLLFLLVVWSLIKIFHGAFLRGAFVLAPVFIVIMLGLSGGLDMLERVGFYVNIGINLYYPDKCKDQTFLLNGTKQYLGICYIVVRAFSDKPEYIIYDTSRQIILSPPDRSSAWIKSANFMSNGRTIIGRALPTRHIWGSYYDVAISIDDVERN